MSSLVIEPPDGPCLVTSSLVRSGLIASQLVPSSVERNTLLPATYRTLTSWGEMTMGYVHWNLYLLSLAPHPPAASGYTVMILVCPVL